MKRKLFTITLVTLFVLLLSAGGAIAQDPEPPEEQPQPEEVEAPQAPPVQAPEDQLQEEQLRERQPQEELSITADVNSRISYQGVLKEDGSPVTGARDMVFRLYSDQTCSTQVGGDIIKSGVSVTDGLFTVALDVGHFDFNGQGLWLEVEVGATSIACREVLPAPYALSLRPGAIIGDTGSNVQLNRYTSFLGLTSKYGVLSEVSGSYTWGYGLFGRASAPGGLTVGVYGLSDSTSGRGVYGRASAASGTTFGVYGVSNSADASSYGGYFSGGYGGLYGLGDVGPGGYFSSTQNHGIYVGTAGYNGAYVEHADYYGVYVEDAGYDGAWVYNAGDDGFYVSYAGGDGVYVYSAGDDGVEVISAGDDGVRVSSAADNGVYAQGGTDASTDHGGYFRGYHGVYGSGSGALGYGGYFASTSNDAIRIESAGDDGVHVQYVSDDGVYIYSPGGQGVYVGSPGDDGVYVSNAGDNGVYVASAADYGVYAYGGTDSSSDYGGSFTGYNGLYARATSGSGKAARFVGNVEIQDSSYNVIMELGAGLDYAEGFDVSDKTGIVPGVVLVIDPDNAGKLIMSSAPYDRKVAGIVAGAGGMGSAVRLGPGQFDHDVALAGRVYCYVDATEAAVEPGDLLTTAATPGYAMKVTDYARAQGAILGKAMEGLEKGEKGLMLVLVTLQ